MGSSTAGREMTKSPINNTKHPAISYSANYEHINNIVSATAVTIVS